ncbi:GMC oxidoreductase [Calothrix sp. 336/3]|uniref:GMC oxidoreductase n=1 Tax=Calothrix sp. 336/3 TaxID=1337936 RepID=UPI0004E3B762|nr:GMC family oxidoreductase [Calothrix sp. 336/3]AKG23059.1 dehydrogenase [Calothrix sp. 336/3]
MANNHYDVIIIGTGAGGGTLAHKLASSGKKILILERGKFLPQEKANWDGRQVFQKGCYRPQETWYDKNGKPFHPVTHYFVGGNTKFYGGALFRFREQDFEQVTHQDGISPEWLLKYRDFAPYYDEAEKLYEVHGNHGLDPTEPPREAKYPFPAISHEPYIQGINDALINKGLHPFHLPMGIKLQEKSIHSYCIRCNTCDGFPCFIHGKADADINGIRPAIQFENIHLITEAKVLRLHTSPSGKEVTGLVAEIDGKSQIFTADIFVVACGAINSAVLLLKSANDHHPYGLANSSQLVGCNYMTHKYNVVVTLSTKRNPTIFQKTLGINDFYWGEPDFPYPMGNIQLLGNLPKDRIAANAPPLTPDFINEYIANHSVAWLLITEDLPDLYNRVALKGDKIYLHYKENNRQASNRLLHRWLEVLKKTAPQYNQGHISSFLVEKMTLKEVSHQCGTCRFGDDSKTSVLDINCRTHDVDNLYVVDGSFFPSSTALNPSLTIMANALRVGEHLLARIK